MEKQRLLAFGLLSALMEERTNPFSMKRHGRVLGGKEGEGWKSRIKTSK